VDGILSFEPVQVTGVAAAVVQRWWWWWWWLVTQLRLGRHGVLALKPDVEGRAGSVDLGELVGNDL